MELLAGAARIEITPAAGVALMGYGLRKGVSREVHDPLCARAIYLGTGGGEAGILIVVADLCLIDVSQARAIRAEVASATGLDPARILVQCTHTHSGPDTGLVEIGRGDDPPAHVAPLLSGVGRAAREAWAARQPARMAWSRARTYIGRNRRDREGGIDPDIRILRVVDDAGEPLALLYHHGCHPTVLGHENLALSADWPGAASARLEQALGCPALFLLGAHGDVDPRTRGLKDLALERQSGGLGFDASEVLGQEVAELVLESLAEGAPGWTREVPRASTLRVRVPLRLGDLPEGSAEADLARRRTELESLLGLSALPRLGELEGALRSSLGGRPLGEVREAIAFVRGYIRDKTAPLFVGGGRELDAEIHVLSLAGTALLGLPFEMTVAVGRDWRSRAGQRGLDGAVMSITNGWLRYMPHPKDLAHPSSHLHYEVLSSLLAPSACPTLLAAAERVLAGYRRA